ncbi:uncharacterized protein LOC120686840 [Panicum virgatum]|uniref:uncharacterized protein LOC120686840 n=1 Tax=Panicum virgatum TaxID=38727 RepID=UPI0019D5899F|nr:uncharacterized protein LOC120686840 [Panicum virgatum]
MASTEGGQGSLAQGATKSAAVAGLQDPATRHPTTRSAKKAAAAATGPHGASRGCSAKRKAARDLASGRMPRSRATGKKAEEAAPVGEQWKRLSKGDIRWILRRKPLAPPDRFVALKQSNPELVPLPDEEVDEDKRRLYRLAKGFYEMEEMFPRLQEWVRAELNRKGYVELDDESAKRRAEAQAVVDREWPAIEARIKALVVSEKDYRGGEGGDEIGSDDSDDSGSDEDHSLSYEMRFSRLLRR